MQEAGAGTVILGSLKDAAANLKEDEPGGNVNRVFQEVVADDREVLVIHHDRKPQGNSRPKLEDVYGSSLITNGAGSVLLLLGRAGDSTIELLHLKQPATEIGPLKVQFDHMTGSCRVAGGNNIVEFIDRSPDGVTAIELAGYLFDSATPSDAQRKNAQRQAEKLVDQGSIYKKPSKAGGRGGTVPARYCTVGRHLAPPAPDETD